MLEDSMDCLTDTHQRKRSFDLANEYQDITSTVRRCVRHGSSSSASTIAYLENNHFTAPATKRRPPLYPTKYSNMTHAEAGSVMSTPFPSFMSIVGKPDASLLKDMEELAAASDSIPDGDTQILVTDAKPPSEPAVQRSAVSLHQHRNSVTSMISASTESSPTNTNSTFDSPVITDSSPGSSPESASSTAPISPFRNIMSNPSIEQPRNPPQQRIHPLKESAGTPPTRPSSVIEATKNVKSLSLNMGAVIVPRPSTAHGFESHAFSAPVSPSKDAPKTGRKKPTNLTIRTPGFQQLTFNRGLDVPPTPSSRPTLHHMSSSPALASLASPKKPPPGGLFLHLPASGTVISGQGSDSSGSGQSANSQLPDLREEEEIQQPQRSQETQEKGYPKGPVLIYDSGVYLYLEPTAEEAAKFDTVINVAKEIKNPFHVEVPTSDAPEPQTAISEMSFKSAWEWPHPAENPTPTTPRPSSFVQQKQPEYLHVPWDHNSEILEDLYCLCRLIDDRIQAGKKVLIHCQLGVSRSASLVIAYGLYKGYQADFHSMYMAVKQRSQWVGPNMSLIYQLTDFRSKVVKGVYGDHCNDPKASWWLIRSSNSPVMDTPIAKQTSWQAPPRLGEPVPAPPSLSFAPPLAKAAPPLRLNKDLPPVPLFPKIESTTVATPIKLSQILGGIARPSPQPAKTPEPALAAETQSPPRAQSPSQSVSPRPLPFRERFDSSPSQPPFNPSKTPKLGLVTTSPKMDLAMEEPSSPSLFSPRAAEFMASPFGITTAGDLAVLPKIRKKPSKGALLPPQVRPSAHFDIPGEQVPVPFDPRSPHQQGEAPEIFRNIEDFL
ncbi:tyrosine/serine/threonine protein phosphatase [Cladophialophora chaetospira]|uniref:protein-tyrosine-phosphatase n=1 Tax=Cladophialophora chaetospira TaxID=386627 RepID=A0AA39CHM7_9EURO|nr:tyrosine/serine/threonine protein phosphatase [Cladophialophora chaetospira]